MTTPAHNRSATYDYASEQSPAVRRVIPHTHSMSDFPLPGQPMETHRARRRSFTELSSIPSVNSNAQAPIPVITATVVTDHPAAIVLPHPVATRNRWDWCVIL